MKMNPNGKSRISPYERWLSRFFPFVLALALCTLPAARAVDDALGARKALTDAARAAVQRRDFVEIEKEGGALRLQKARLPEGLWKSGFYVGGLAPRSEVSEEEFAAWFKIMEAWAKAYPQSTLRRVVLAEGWTDYAWKARCSDYADKVTPDGLEKYSERIKRARAVLEEVKDAQDRIPEWYTTMQTVALAQGWNETEYDKLFKAAVGMEPTYYLFYFNKAHYLLPRWHGEPGQLEAFAEQAARVHDSKEGMTVYTRIAWSKAELYKDLFAETKFTWPKMKQGFEDMMRTYPNSAWNLNNFAKFACKAQDRTTARGLLVRIGDDPDLGVWKTLENYEKAREWAGK